MQEGDNVVEHINKMIVMAKDLSTAGTEIPKRMQVATILNSLPPSLAVAATTLRMNHAIKSVTDLPMHLAIEQDLIASRKEPELNMVQQELNYVRQRHNAGSYKNPGSSKPQPRGPKSQQFKRKKVPRGACYNCEKFGHFKPNCPQGEKQENKGGYKHPEQGGTSKREFVDVTECNAVMTDISGWWIDSGATRHIAKDKNGVVEFTELKK